MSTETKAIYKFGEFKIDALARTLRREEEIVTLNRRAFDVLLYFVQNPGKVLTRDELLKNVWTETFVDENSLAQSISALRRALEEKPGDNSYIVTLPGRGYQFVSPVQVVLPESGNAVSEGATTDRSSGLLFEKHTIQTRVVTSNKEQLSPPTLRSRTLVRFATLAIAATLVGGAWFWRSHRAPKLTEKDTIVIADFDNRTGDPVFDDTLKRALEVDLDQSPYLNVVSDQKISEGLKLMGRDGGQRLTGEVARDLCQRVNSNALLQSSIASLGKQYIVVLAVTNCATGDALASEQGRAESKEKILPALDKAVSSLRGKLGESLGSIEKYDTPVEEATTPSLAALQAYSAGVTIWGIKGNEAAIPFYKRAIELDPNFAMASARLGQAYDNMGADDAASENTKKAFNLRARVSEKERFYIDSHYYGIVTGDEEKSIQVLEQWRQVYPREARPAIVLVWRYRLLGRYEDALREAKDAVRLEPGAETSHEALAGITLALNRLDEAQTALKEWQALKPDSVIPVVNQYQLAFLQSDPAGMEKQLARAAGTKPLEGMLLSMQSDTEAYYGRLRKAREFTRRAAEAEGSDKETASARCANFKLGSAFREAEFGYPQQARRDVTAALTLSSGPSIQARAALVLALTADTGRAETIAAELARRYPLDTVGNRYWFPTIRAAIQLSRNNPAQAVQDLEATLRYELGGGWEQAYVRGQAFLVMHRGREAAAEFQKYIDHPGAVMNNPLGALARAGLARAYVLQGDTAKAKTTYQDFLTLWKDADPDIPVLKQAKAEYAKLQ